MLDALRRRARARSARRTPARRSSASSRSTFYNGLTGGLLGFGDVANGLVKSVVFGIVMALASCHFGLADDRRRAGRRPRGQRDRRRERRRHLRPRLLRHRSLLAMTTKSDAARVDRRELGLDAETSLRRARRAALDLARRARALLGLRRARSTTSSAAGARRARSSQQMYEIGNQLASSS